MDNNNSNLHWWKVLSVMTVALSMSILLGGCERPEPSSTAQVKAAPEAPVAVATPKLKRAHLVKDTYPADPKATWSVTASGVRWRDLVVGDGDTLTSDSIGYFHIKTFLNDGTFHHSTMNERKPVCAAMGAGRLQREFEEALLGMRERGRRLVEFPAGLSYWSAGHLADGPALPPGSSPRFDVTLLLVQPQKQSRSSGKTSGTSSTREGKEVNP
jgi:FKBP-type peptidyl-prolyl cis-trans isomerase